MEVVNKGPLRAHKFVIGILQQKLDAIEKESTLWKKTNIEILREQVINAHRENACFYKLLCEFASNCWLEHSNECKEIAVLLPTPPDPILIAFRGFGEINSREFEWFRFLHGAKNTDFRLLSPQVFAGTLKERVSSIEIDLKRIPKVFQEYYLEKIANGWESDSVQFSARELGDLNIKQLDVLLKNRFLCRSFDIECEQLFRKYEYCRLDLCDSLKFRKILKNKTDSWLLILRSLTDSRTDLYNIIFPERDRYLVDFSENYCKLYKNFINIEFKTEELDALMEHILSNSSYVDNFWDLFVKCTEIILSQRGFNSFANSLIQIKDDTKRFEIYKKNEYLIEKNAKKFLRKVGFNEYAMYCESLDKRLFESWGFATTREILFSAAIKHKAPLTSKQFLFLVSSKFANDFSADRILEIKNRNGDSVWKSIVNQRFQNQKYLKRKDFTDYYILLHWFKGLPLNIRLQIVSIYPNLKKQLSTVKDLPPRTKARSLDLAEELSLALGGWSVKQLQYLIVMAWKDRKLYGKPHGCSFDDYYLTYLLPKKSGGNRTITAPSKLLKSLQTAILKFLLSDVKLTDCVHGFRTGHSTLTNALPHVGKDLVINLDIKNFFPSVKFEQVHRALRRELGEKLSIGSIRFLAEVCSYKGSLPTGAPTSPVLANIILTPLDKSLLSVCNQYGISYSRYADDLTFSGSSDVKKIIPFVKKCLGGFGLEIESKKLNLYRRGRRQIVTGIVVNDKVNLPRKIRRKLRAAVHSSSIGKQTKWHGKPMNVGELKGHLSYLQSVNPDEAMRLKQILAEGAE
jgi:hypothetical protein